MFQTVDKVKRTTMLKNIVNMFLKIFAQNVLKSRREIESRRLLHRSDLFSPSRGTVVQLRGEEKVIL